MKLRVAFFLLFVAVTGPPLYYAVVPEDAPTLPPPGERVELRPGTSVNVLERGEGPPVVLVHGHPGTAYDWVPVQERLVALIHRVIAYDRVGYGRSDGRSDGAYTLEQNARELLALLEAKDLRDVTLVGWSYGGGTSIVATRTDPSRIARIVLLSSIGPGIVDEREVLPPVVFDWTIKPLLTWLHHVPPLFRIAGEAATDAAFAPEAVTDNYRTRAAANFAMPHTFVTTRSESQDLATPGLLDPADLARPILVVHGDGDQLSSIAIGRTLHERAAKSTLEVVPGGGHMLPLTRPGFLAERIHAFAGS